MDTQIVPVILAGGKGRRLRPLTSNKRPKPLLRLGDKHSLYQKCLMRVAPFAPPVTVTHVHYIEAIIAHNHEVHGRAVVDSTFLCEPVGRNTAAAITMAALHLNDMKPDTMMAIMPSDHIIDDDVVFQNTVRRAAMLAAEKNTVVSLGVSARKPATNFGYIWSNKDFKIFEFIEKPGLKKSRELIECTHMFWNTGIFCVRVCEFLDVLKRHVPDIYESCKLAHSICAKKDQCIYYDEESYGRIPSLAIDYAVMERLENAYCLPLESTWSDVGTWSSLQKHLASKLFS